MAGIIKVFRIEPGKYGEIITMRNSEADFREEVGGELEFIPLCSTGGVLVDKDSNWKNVPFNCYLEEEMRTRIVKGTALALSKHGATYSDIDDATLDALGELTWRKDAGIVVL